jgi:hypothetical protein
MENREGPVSLETGPEESKKEMLKRAYDLVLQMDENISENLAALRQEMINRTPVFSKEENELLSDIFIWVRLAAHRGLSVEDKEFIRREEGEVESGDEELDTLKFKYDMIKIKAQTLHLS